MDGTPHRMAGKVINGVVNAVEGVGTSANHAVQGLGGSLQGLADAPWQAVGLGDSPLHIADRVADGMLNAGDNAINNGIFGSAKQAGEAINRGLDWLPEKVGLPPDLGNIGSGLGKKIQMPKMGRR